MNALCQSVWRNELTQVYVFALEGPWSNVHRVLWLSTGLHDSDWNLSYTVQSFQFGISRLSLSVILPSCSGVCLSSSSRKKQKGHCTENNLFNLNS